MANDAPATIQLLTPSGLRSFSAAIDNLSNVSLQSTPRVNGAAVDQSNPMPVGDAASAAHFGADGTGIAQPTGGSGVRGWLSGIYQSALTMVTSLASIVSNTGTVAGAVSGARVQATIATSLPAGTNAIGSVTPFRMNVVGTVVTVPAEGNVQLVAANSNRRFLSIMNIDTGLATLAPDAAPTVGSGWPLSAANESGDQGGGYVWDAGSVPTNAFYAASTAGTRVTVWEGV